MTVYRRIATYVAACAVVTAFLTAAPTRALAQATCEINESSPTVVGKAFVSLQNALNDTNPEGRLRNAKNAIRDAATQYDRGQNLPGRDYIIAKAMLLILHIPDIEPVTTRGELGFDSNLNESVDMVVAVDSLFKKVEASHPGCATEIADWRFSQPFIDLLTDAMDAMTVDSLDKAKNIARRAQLLESKSPYSWQMLASIATRERNEADAMNFWQRTYDAAGDDTSTKAVKEQALYYLGETQLYEATNNRTGAEAAAKAREAVKYFEQFVRELPEHKDAPAARTNLAQAYSIVGDTARVPSVYQALLPGTGNFDANAYLQAGVVATSVERYDDAATLFGNALKLAPCDRDALYNLSVSLFQAEKFDTMIPIVSKLYDVDPNNPSNVQMVAYAYAMVDAKETDMERKKVLADSLAKYQAIYDKIDTLHKVEYSVFQRQASRTALTGRVHNLSNTPKAYTLEFQFLNKDCTPVGSGSVTTGVVQPKTDTRFEVVLDQGGISAFRAMPIPIPPA